MDNHTIFYDLDGTLTDPKEGITKSVQYSLKHFGIEEPDLDGLVRFIGPPLKESFLSFYGFSDRDADLAVAKYREYFAETGIYQNKLYDGIKEMLEEQRRSGKRLVLATSKPLVFARDIVRDFHIAGYFHFLSGSELNGERTAKDEVIRYAMDACGITSAAGCIMVGDRKHDILGARKVGMDSVGVLYGYGEEDEIRRADPTHIVKDIGELARLLK